MSSTTHPPMLCAITCSGRASSPAMKAASPSAAPASELSRKLEQAIAKLADAGVHRFQSRNGVYFTDRPFGGKSRRRTAYGQHLAVGNI